MSNTRNPLISARLAAGLGLVLAAGLIAGLAVTVGASGARASTLTWTRSLEPAVYTGAQLSGLDGAPLDDLFVYAYDGSTWAQIPFQFDEVDASGYYTAEDGLLDGNDELAFMSRDLGVQAPATEWLDDADSRAHRRAGLLVTNPLNPAERGWVYVYRSATLVPALPTDYVDYDRAGNRIVAQAYVAGFNPSAFAGLDSLELNGSGVDVLDRSKIRASVDCYVGLPWPVPLNLTENDLAGQFGGTPDIDGPVRVGGGGPEGSSWAYASLVEFRATVDTTGVTPIPPCTRLVFNEVRMSIDWRNPVDSGMGSATYYDANRPAGVPIDGAADDVPGTPITQWREISGARGTVFAAGDVSASAESVTNYYKDSAAIDTSDTGDQQSFGDAGIRVVAPSGQIVADMQMYILGASQPNVSATYLGYREHPLQLSAVAQSYYHTYLPIVLKRVVP